MVYASDEPVRVPETAPFNKTNPFAWLTRADPVTLPVVCVSVHVIRPVTP